MTPDVREAQAEFIRKHGATDEIIDVYTEDNTLYVLLDRPVEDIPSSIKGVGVQTKVIGGYREE